MPKNLLPENYFEIYVSLRKSFLVESIISEIGHSFSNQYDISEKCAEKCVEMLRFNENTCIIDVEEIGNKRIKNVMLTIKKDDYKFNISASLENIDSDGLVKIVITIGNSNYIESKENVKKSLVSIIAHELSHANIFYNRYENGEELNDIPEYYEKVLKVINTCNPNSFEYMFCYGLYSTYYHEVQSLISQSYGEFLKHFDAEILLNGITKKEFIQYFKLTNTFRAFSSNIEIYECFYGKQLFLEKASIELRKHGIEMTSKEINCALKRMKNISAESIKKSLNNCYLLFLENGGKII